MTTMRLAAIIAAAGQSKRFGGPNKLEQPLGGRAVLLRSVEMFANRNEVSAILVAVDPDRMDEIKDRFGDALGMRGAKLVAGGKKDRWETVKNALTEIPSDATHIAVHDAARPCLSAELLERLVEAAKLFDAVIPAVPVSATLKRVGEETEAAVEDDPIASTILGDAGSEKLRARTVVETVDRTNVWAVQTPQIFAADLLRRAYAQSDLASTDDATLIERLGETVRVVEGDPLNIKITTKTDFRLAEMILGAKPEKERPAHLRF